MNQPIYQVPCAVSIRTARSVIEEIPEAASSSIASLAACAEDHSGRDVQRLTQKYKLSIPIPFFDVEVGAFSVPIMKFSEWAKWLLSMNMWHVLSGLKAPDPEECKRRWSSFWSRYQNVCPSHEAFHGDLQVDFSRTCGLMLHGDEGRSVGKTPIMIVSVHSIIGFGLRTAKRKKTRHDGMRLNYEAPTWCTRYLLSALPKAYYDDTSEGDPFQDLMKVIATDLRSLFSHGLKGPDGNLYKFIVLNSMGDWPWQIKCGMLGRSFMNVAKHGTAAPKARPKGICHRCLADRDAIWEDFENSDRAWFATVDTESPFLGVPEVLCLVPNPQNQPAFFSWDFFHGWNLGAAKGFIASCIVVLAMGTLYEGSVDARLSAVSDSFISWCRRNKSPSRLKKINKEKLNWPSSTVYPSGAWSKGSTSTYLMKWLLEIYSENLNTLVDDELAQLAFKAMSNMDTFVRGIYSYELWIPSPEAKKMAQAGLDFLKYQGRAAGVAFQQDRRLFLAMPNLHRLDHIFTDLKQQSSMANFCLNPLHSSTQADEDYIGRPSRLSRRVSPRLVVLRTLQRSLQAAYSSYVKAGLLILDAD